MAVVVVVAGVAVIVLEMVLDIVVEAVVVVIVVVKLRSGRGRIDGSRSRWSKKKSTIGLVVDHLHTQWPWEVASQTWTDKAGAEYGEWSQVVSR